MRLGQGLVIAAVLAGATASSAEATPGNTVHIGTPDAYSNFHNSCIQLGYPDHPLDATVSMQSFTTPSGSSSYLAVPDDGIVKSWSAVAGITTKDDFPTASVQFAVTTGVSPHPSIVYKSPPGAYLDLFYSNDIPVGSDSSEVTVSPGQSIALVMHADSNNDSTSQSEASLACITNPSQQPTSWAAWTDGGDQIVDTADPTAGQMLAFGATVVLDLPEVASIDAAGGPVTGGNSLTISGNHLANPVNVTVGSYSATVTSASNTSLTVTVPPQDASRDGKGAEPVTVYTAGGKSVLAAAYTYGVIPPTPTPVPTATPEPAASQPAPTIAPIGQPGPVLPQPKPITIPSGTLTDVKTSVSTKHAISLSATVSPAGSLHAKATATVVGATGRAKKSFSFGSATVKAKKAGKVSLTLAPSATATADLKHHHLAVTIALTFTPTTGAAATHETTLTVK